MERRETSYTECLQPGSCDTLYYEEVAMDKRFQHRQFHDVYRILTENGRLQNCENREAGILWRLPTPANCKENLQLTPWQQSRLIASGREEVCIFDLEADYSWLDYLMDMDALFVVVDPLPSKLIRSRERFRALKKLELNGCPVIWIVNRHNEGVDKKQVKQYLQSKNVLWLNSIDSKEIYCDEYFCRFHWENTEIQRKMIEIFTKVSPIHRTLSWFSI